jgi:hypothetical protein
MAKIGVKSRKDRYEELEVTNVDKMTVINKEISKNHVLKSDTENKI